MEEQNQIDWETQALEYEVKILEEQKRFNEEMRQMESEIESLRAAGVPMKTDIVANLMKHNEKPVKIVGKYLGESCILSHFLR